MISMYHNNVSLKKKNSKQPEDDIPHPVITAGLLA
jgi:hypothetical protein